MKITLTKNSMIIFQEKDVDDDRFEEILLTLKPFGNKRDYDLFVEDCLKMEYLNVADIFD